MHYDVVIVGGGVVGTSLALALKETTLSVLLIDARHDIKHDPRLFALTTSSCQLLRNLQIWPALNNQAAPIREVHISREKRFGTIRLKAQDIAQSTLGYVIPAYLIEAALIEQLKNHQQVQLLRPASLKSLQMRAEAVHLTIETASSEQEIEANIVIGADGTESTVRSQLTIPAEVIDYDQQAIVSKIKLAEAPGDIAYERFSAKGTIAMLPLQTENNGWECASIWSVDKSYAQSLLSLTDEDYLHALQQRFGHRLGALQSCSPRYTYPLRAVLAEKNVLDRVFLLGNAAHTLHPVASQGLNLAFYELALLAETFIAKNKMQQTIMPADLETVAQAIKTQQRLSVGLSHHLAAFFAKPFPLMSFALQMGMLGFDLAKPLKKQFMRGMLGRVSYTPRLLLSVEQ